MIKQRFSVLTEVLILTGALFGFWLICIISGCNMSKPISTEIPPTLGQAPGANSAREKTEYIKISPQEAQTMIADYDVIILDVRTKEEFDEGHIINAVLLPLDQIQEKAANITSILADKDQTILIYCRTGRRSAIASEELIKMGYTSVFDFGGIVDWTGEIVREN